MKVQVLVSTMNRTEFSFLEKMKIQGEAFVVNQCDRNGYETVQGNNYMASILNTSQKKGLSNSRNEAMLHATGDVFLTADDDIQYTDNALTIIGQIFEQNPEADIVAFNIDQINKNLRPSAKKNITKWRRSPTHRYYYSVSLAFRTESVKRANLSFHPWFGTGSIYQSGEETLFLREARKAGLKVYESPEIIATHDFAESSWFEGFNERWFHDIGAWVRYAYPKTRSFIKFYYMRYVKHSDLSFFQALRLLNQGIKNSRRGIPYSEST